MKILFIVSSLLLYATNNCFADYSGDRQKIENILSYIDAKMDGLDQHLAHIADDIVHMPHKNPATMGLAAYKKSSVDFFTGGKGPMKHEIIKLHSFPELVMLQGKASGEYQPNGDTKTYSWETKNFMVFKRTPNGNLKLWRLIHNTNSP